MLRILTFAIELASMAEEHQLLSRFLLRHDGLRVHQRYESNMGPDG